MGMSRFCYNCYFLPGRRRRLFVSHFSFLMNDYFFPHTKGILENTGLNDITASDKINHHFFQSQAKCLGLVSFPKSTLPTCVILLIWVLQKQVERLFGVFSSELHTTSVFKTTKLENENKIFQSLGNSPSKQLSRKISNVSFAA